MEEPLLSAYGRASVAPSPVNRMMAAFASDFRDGVDINLGVGYVNEQTIPADLIADAVTEVAAHPERHRQALNYGGPEGSPGLLAAFRRFRARRGLDDETLESCRTIVGPNGATSLLDGLAAVLGPGIIITADPWYYIYCNQLERMGFEIVTVPEGTDGVSDVALREAIDRLGSRREAVRMVYLVTVNNPTGTVMSNANRRGVASAVAELSRALGHKVPLVLDKAYDLLVHDPETERPASALPWDDDGLVFEVDTLSKVLAPSLRIGFLTGPAGPLMDALVQRTSDAGFSAPLLLQEAAGLLLDRAADARIGAVNTGYREKALAVRAAIGETLGPWLDEARGGRAGFYYYLTLRGIETGPGSPFFRFLSRTLGNVHLDGPMASRKPRVVYIPGVFCVRPGGPIAEAGQHQLRISYGFEDTPAISRALRLMAQAAAYAERQG
jgi:2-aminoadipate transaminase